MDTRVTSAEPLKIAVLIGPMQDFQNWEIALLERLIGASPLSLEALLLDGADAEEERTSFLFRAVSGLDGRLLCPRQHASAIGADAIAAIPRLSLSDADASGRTFDIIVSHLSGPPPAKALALCDQLLTYDFLENGSEARGITGFYECLEGRPVTQIAIRRHRLGHAPTLVGTCTTNTKFSASFNAQYAKSMLPPLVERELLREFRRDPCASGEAIMAIADRCAPMKPPGALDCMRYVAVVLGRTGRRVLDGLLRKLGAEPEQWSLVTSSGDILNSSLGDLTELHQPKGEFRADPFLFEKDGERYVFFERFTPGKSDGKIGVGRLCGNRIEGVRQLDFGDIHNSYPYVFEHEGGTFMIPETSERNRVEVWRCERFPDKWTLHATALEGQSPADTVMFEWDGQWWLFTNLSTGGFHDHCAELHVYRVDGPDLKTIEAHPLNPVVLDTTSARNGGRPFVRDNRLIRPAQITSHGRYGYGLKFLEITSLSIETYCEREIRRIEPCTDQRTIGCHHFDAVRDLFIFDARRAYGAKLMGAHPIAVRAS
jgi:hypothetical protein